MALQRLLKTRILLAGLVLLLRWGSCTVQAQDLETIAKQDPIKFTGSLALFADQYMVKGIAPRSVPFNWRLSGTPTVQLFGMVFPFYFNIGTQNRSFAQPFNQFGVSPRYKWVTLHGGWRNLSYSQYTLSGLMFLGGGVDLTPGKFRFSAMYGRFTRAVRADVAQQFVTPQPAFTRKGFAAKIGFGTAQNHLDFIFFKAQDDSSSYLDAPDKIKPQENAVFGISSKLLIAKHVQITLDGAVSGYTRNTQMEILEGDAYQRVRNVLFVNPTTQFLSAANASLGYVSKYVNLRARYRRVDQDFKSMGAYLFETDAEAITVEPSFNLLKNKIKVSGSIGQQRDNLMKTKMVTTNRTIGSVGLSVNPHKVYGIDIQYGNYGIAQRAGVAPINDTVRLALTNQNMNVINRFSFINSHRAFSIVLMNVYQEMRNVNPVSPAFIESTVFLTNLTVNYTFLKRKTSLIGGLNYSKNSFSLGEIVMVGPMAGLGKSFLKDKLSATLSTGFMSNTYSLGNNKGLTMNGSLNLNYQLHKSHSFLVNIRAIRNTATNVLSVPFSEAYFTAGYQMAIR